MDIVRAHKLSLVALPLLAACAAGGVGDAVRPTDPTLSGARGEKKGSCHQVGSEGTPLVVDWQPEARGDLEVAMKTGVAVVHYDCQAIQVLPDCHVDGAYGYVGTSKKEQLITLEDADEAAVNLPFSGAKIGASLKRGSALDIGLVMVGKRASSSLEIDRSMLTGRCDGATHFVRAATVGAFAMKTSSAGQAKVAADVFGVGASAGSDSSKSVNDKDGDIVACQSADPDATQAPKNCNAIVRVQLLAIGGGGSAGAGSHQPEREVACAEGMVASRGKCVPAGTSAPHDCDMKNAADCVTQCRAGSTFSCEWASLVYSLGVDVTKDQKKVIELEKQGCDLGSGSSCTGLGLDTMKGDGTKKDVSAGLALVTKGCDRGDAMGCATMGDAYLGELSRIEVSVAVDVPRAVRYMRKACNAGQGHACGKLGTILDEGKGVTADKRQAQDAFKRGCAAKDKASCARVGKNG